MAPRWTYIDPAIAFNPVISFTVLIMALLGGVHRLYGPVLGVVPLALLFEYLLASFPNHFSIMVGLVFIVIVYLIPRGIAGLVERRGEEAGMSALLEVDGPDPPLRRARRRRCARLLGRSRARSLACSAPTAPARRPCSISCRACCGPTAGAVAFRGHAIAGKPAHRIARLGMARTFQLVRPLASLSCRDNVLTGLAFGRRNAWGAAARTEADDAARPRRSRPGARHAAGRAHLHRPEAPGARPRAGAASPNCCCSTNGWPASTRPSWRRASRLIRSLARAGHHHPAGRARHGRHPLALPSLPGDERRPADRRRACRPRCWPTRK